MDNILSLVDLGALPFGGDLLLPLAIGLGVFAIILGLGNATNKEPEIQRRRMMGGEAASADRSIIRLSDNDPTGSLRLFVPHSGKERSKIALQMRQAGIHDVHAVRRYFLFRSGLSLFLPMAFIALAWFGQALPVQVARFLDPLSRLSMLQVFQISVLLIALGFYGPTVWLRNKVAERKLAISRGMPGALDLLQVAVGAGLGFEAAITRVARELHQFSPAIAEEFTILQLEIQAGKPRDLAFAELERRTGVAEMASFANVVQQSSEFGTPISAALETYAEEMRIDREMKAQTRANQLPVKMSGVLAGCMMPALLLIMITPVAIRWVEMMK